MEEDARANQVLSCVQMSRALWQATVLVYAEEGASTLAKELALEAIYYLNLSSEPLNLLSLPGQKETAQNRKLRQLFDDLSSACDEKNWALFKCLARQTSGKMGKKTAEMSREQGCDLEEEALCA